MWRMAIFIRRMCGEQKNILGHHCSNSSIQQMRNMMITLHMWVSFTSSFSVVHNNSTVSKVNNSIQFNSIYFQIPNACTTKTSQKQKQINEMTTLRHNCTF